MTGSRRQSQEELAVYNSAFSADDSLVTIVPTFESSCELPLLSFGPVGPFQAGMPTTVPLWMALLLYERSLCTISPPAWLNARNLAEIVAFEKKHDRLFDDTNRLPTHYYEIAKRLTARRGIVYDTDNNQALALLVQDLLDVRVDKLRQQLPAILAGLNDNANAALTLSINGIASQELALLRQFIQQALNDRAFLMDSKKKEKEDIDNEVPSQIPETKDNVSAQESKTTTKTRVPLRRFRR